MRCEESQESIAVEDTMLLEPAQFMNFAARLTVRFARNKNKATFEVESALGTKRLTHRCRDWAAITRPSGVEMKIILAIVLSPFRAFAQLFGAIAWDCS